MRRSSPDLRYLHPKRVAPQWTVPSTYMGPVVISDLDKTYLETEIHSFWGLVKTAFEAPEKKRNISGVLSLLRHLRKDASRETEQPAPLFFVSASPPQMRRKTEAKLRLDHLDFTYIHFKNQLEHVRRGQFHKLRQHVGYKLITLMRIWYHLPKNCSLLLLGDDSENDVLTYCLFEDVVEQKMTGRSLLYLLKDLGLDRQEALTIARWQRDFPKANPVKEIYIHLITKTDPAYYEKFGPHVTPTRNAFQIAVNEFFAGRLTQEGVSAVAYEMHVTNGMTTFALRKSAEDLVVRKRLKEAEGHALWSHLLIQKLLDEPPHFQWSTSTPPLPTLHDPLPLHNEQLKMRMKYYEEMT